MNILFYTDTAVPHLGGKSSHIIELKNGLEAIGHHADIISVCSISPIQRKIDKIKKVFILHYKKSDYGTYSYKSMKITDRSIQKVLKTYLKTHKVDVISAQDPASVLYAKEVVGESIPITLTMHSYFGKSMSVISNEKTEMRQKDYDRLRDRDLESLKIIKELITVDTRIKEDCEGYMEENPDFRVNTTAVPNFVNTDVYSPASKEEKAAAKEKLGVPADKKVMICIRRLVDKNGVFFAIEAMKKVEGVVLLVGGDGPNMEKLRKYVEENGLSDKVKLLGGVDGQMKKDVYSAADFAIVPSITVHGLQEATSISAIEAMSCGHCIIVSEIGGLAELVQNGENGISVPEQRSDLIAKELNGLLADDELRNKLLENARNTVIAKYSHIAAAEKYLNIFERAKGN